MRDSSGPPLKIRERTGHYLQSAYSWAKCNLLKISYPEALPVSRHREKIRNAVNENQVVIVCGDTGSGKTTQLPKIALDLGRGSLGKKERRQIIGCTQPRRIAATSVARRVAEELQVEFGSEVGYQIRFEDRTSRERTSVKFMTDGILLAETQGDPNLGHYDTLIIDEAHERSLNIDFILGYLHRLLPKRPDLKIIISSATLDAESFSDFFDGAPVIQVEGRTFPVEDVYHPPLDGRERMADQVARAAEWLGELDPLGDTLVFLPGEREIRDCADLLDGRRYPSTLILPLYARQAGNDQQAVFKPMPHRRRIILATNVAETSLTIPDIRSVIDSGVARVNRYDPFSGIERLQVEPVSKASARQRRGRCGRVSDGLCVRLYDEEDFESRNDYTDPEILRTNLAGVVLQMEHLGLGDPLKFPFVDKPQPKRIAQAYKTLEEIGAIWKKGQQSGLTDVGHTLARLPLDPRVGRILVAAEEEGCVREALIVASALTVQDPRERPQDKQQQADQAHARFRDKRSDFTGWLRWWHAISEAKQKSNNALRRFCQENFINYRRLQEWIRLHRELRDVLRNLRWKLPDAKKNLPDPIDTYSEPLHRAILTAIPSHIGLHQGKQKGYKGAGNRTFFLFPGSGVFGTAPAWVMAFEMVETAKLYARNIAMFDPATFEKAAPHLCRYRYTRPHWVPEQGAVYGEESVIAFGLPVVEKRPVHFGRFDAKVAREIFILEALVNGNTRSPPPQLKKNRETIAAAQRLEHKLRRLGGMLHDDAIIAFYHEIIPPDMCTQKAFEKWASKLPPETLELSLEDCIVPQVDPINAEAYPDTVDAPDGETTYELLYQHAPSEEPDGITVKVPLGDLPHLPEWFGDWIVEGWLQEKVATVFRILHKDFRTLLPSNRELVEGFLDEWPEGRRVRPLLSAVIHFLRSHHGIEVSESAFDLARIPEHLHMRFEVIADNGSTAGTGRQLPVLQEQLAGDVKARFSTLSEAAPFEQRQLIEWSFGDLPSTVPLDKHTVGYPGLQDDSGEVRLRLWPDKICAQDQHRLGVARLFRIACAERVSRLEAALFSSGSRPKNVKPKPAPITSKPVKTQKSDGFGSLAHAFGSAPAQSTPSAVAPPKARLPEAASPAPLPSLTPEHQLLLGHLGREPKRNRDDLVTVILMETLGAPRTLAEWNKAIAKADRDLFDGAGRICSQLSALLAVAESISTQLSQYPPSYTESLGDARDHFDSLLRPGWILAGKLPDRLTDLRGLELRLTRLRANPAAKDLAKMARYQSEAAVIWKDEVDCPCGECTLSSRKTEQIESDFDLRLKEFAQELRGRMRK
jgi:ATP-dependent helicase HrpA